MSAGHELVVVDRVVLVEHDAMELLRESEGCCCLAGSVWRLPLAGASQEIGYRYPRCLENGFVCSMG